MIQVFPVSWSQTKKLQPCLVPDHNFLREILKKIDGGALVKVFGRMFEDPGEIC